MRKTVILALALLSMCGCGSIMTTGSDSQKTETAKAAYKQITAEDAKAMMDEHAEAVILDVREQSEFDSGHISGAVLLPVGTINEECAAAVISEKDTITLVYCRSGNRSKTAAEALVELGYTQVYEFGGIIDWPYEIE